MIYTEMTKKALKLSFFVHKSQYDKGGIPYVYHPYHLAEQMQDEDTVVVALLHDVLEDSLCTIEDIYGMGFNSKVCQALIALTHNKNTSYMDYIKAIKQNPIAKAVKIADLTHNMDTTRLENPKVNKQLQYRLNKYRKALELLQSE